MPKFYHGERFGIAYKARAVGFGRRFPFKPFPYLTSADLKVHIQLKNKGQWWTHGNLLIDPLPLFRNDPFTGFTEDWTKMSLADATFEIPVKSEGGKYEKTIVIFGESRTRRSGEFLLNLRLVNTDPEKATKCRIPIADIDIVSRGMFWLTLATWIGSIFVAISGIVAGIAIAVLGGSN
jgi:hypothetical protein